MNEQSLKKMLLILSIVFAILITIVLKFVNRNMSWPEITISKYTDYYQQCDFMSMISLQEE